MTFFVAVALCGCGDDSAPLQSPDAAPPLPMPDASAPARVTVVSGSGPVVGVPVVFHGIAEVMTDSEGHASQVITPDTTITAAWFDGYSYRADTVLGIQPGDDVILGFPDPAAQQLTGPSGTIEISVPPFEGATRYIFEDGCFDGEAVTADPTATLRYSPDCLSNGNLTVLVRASDIFNGTLAVTGGTFSAPVTSASFTWSAPSALEVDLVNAPERSYLSIVPAFDTIFWGWAWPTMLVKGDARIWLPEPSVGMFPDYSITVARGSSAMDQRVAANSPLVVDFRPFVPEPVSPAIDGSTIRWAASGPMDTVQGVSVTLEYMGSDHAGHLWTITLPPAFSVRLPDLPVDLSSYAPLWPPLVTVTFFASTRFHSYADIRRMPMAATQNFMRYSPGPYRFFYASATHVPGP